MQTLVLDNGSKYINSLVGLVKTFFDDVVVQPIESFRFQPEDKYKIVVLSGSFRFSPLFHSSVYTHELKLIKSCRQPIVGICIGFELIAQSFGCSLEKLNEKEKGVKEIEFTEKGKELFDIQERTFVYESHSLQISNVSKSFIPLAISPKCIEMIQHTSLPIIGTQFHPEVQSIDTQGKKIFEKTISYLLSNIY